jgi:hypothetical protein
LIFDRRDHISKSLTQMQWDVRDVLAHVQQLVERTPVPAP